MRLRLLQATAAPVVLGDDEAGLFISDYRVGQPVAVEAWRPYKALYPVFFAHGFEAASRSFKVDRVHDSAAAAFIFSEEHPALIPQLATLEIIDDSGVVYVPVACRAAQLAARNGRTTVFAYDFDCGEVAKDNPLIT